MKNSLSFNKKSVLVVGLAKSGFAAAKLLHSLGSSVTVNDFSGREGNKEAEALELEGIRTVCGGHPIELLNEPVDFIVKNPGIPYSNALISEAVKRGIPVVTEIELASQIAEAEIVAITGSNGKTTTTTLVGLMLEGSSKKPVVAGNIGTVLCEMAAKSTEEEVLVAELSSFQLMGTETFHPKVAVLLNLFEAHLDYHGTFGEYGAAKGKIFANQTVQDFAVFNADDQAVSELAARSQARKVPFSAKRVLTEGGYIKDGNLYFYDEDIIPVSEIVLPGRHSLENILAAVCAAKLAGAKSERIREVLKTFTGVKHRLQFVEEIDGVKVYNDSKATNILATSAALSAFSSPVVLLAGGLDRGNEFDELIPHLKNVKALVCFGQTAQKIKEAGLKAGIHTIVSADNVEDAVPKGFGLAMAGDVLLLSPACASWDQYKTFEQRGDMFISSVHKLK
ncbi:UDP-N-acetylmuramoyl-L-alanine--D-glutamate ligase [Fictibacillus aquaticus]|uniref:UDP-N-acetylmuramoylalanine--D-glutamate ligase n=1 Tax=Fictibacillus aquaticus TaxID=2021314 RepID=A0A235FD96_9BACL|nr:UDP-N-acetylmuramoyl-L-alanine--D-glutamate ligase [Fictibacillus aquaticus]OYD58944.1 UDP-N-acetylmuramoyl-L-alanine--D-glutamate ligase [Fictibacillus aquaticus]